MPSRSPTLSLPSVVNWWRRTPPRAGDCRVLGLDGRSGSGKSTLAAALAASAPEAIVVHLEEAYPGWDGLAAVLPRIRDDLLEPLAAGLPAGIRRWDWARETDGPRLAVPAAPLILLEGVGACARPLRDHLSGGLWLTAPAPTRRHRALARDGDTYAPHWARWARHEAAYLREHRPDRWATLVLDTGGPATAAAPLRVLADRRERSRPDLPPAR